MLENLSSATVIVAAVVALLLLAALISVFSTRPMSPAERWFSFAMVVLLPGLGPIVWFTFVRPLLVAKRRTEQ